MPGQLPSIGLAQLLIAEVAGDAATGLISVDICVVAFKPVFDRIRTIPQTNLLESQPILILNHLH